MVGFQDAGVHHGECSGQRARGMQQGLALGDSGSGSVSTLQHEPTLGPLCSSLPLRPRSKQHTASLVPAVLILAGECRMAWLYMLYVDF